MNSKELKKYYDERGIAPFGFKCQHLKSCIQVAETKSKFACGRGAFIGSEYESGVLPKLLFLSLDSGSASLDPNNRTFEATQRRDLAWLPANRAVLRKHWYITHQFAWHIFNEINKKFSLRLDIGDVDEDFFFRPVEEIHKIKSFFAHTNSIKCSVNKEHRMMAPKVMFRNCRNHIVGELKTLDSDIIVSQGDFAWDVVNQTYSSQIVMRENISRANPKKYDFCLVKMSSGKMILWIHHYHPSATRKRGTRFHMNYDHYEVYAKGAAEFIYQYHPIRNNQ